MTSLSNPGSDYSEEMDGNKSYDESEMSENELIKNARNNQDDLLEHYEEEYVDPATPENNGNVEMEGNDSVNSETPEKTENGSSGAHNEQEDSLKNYMLNLTL
jgi:hypothetical protein